MGEDKIQNRYRFQHQIHRKLLSHNFILNSFLGSRTLKCWSFSHDNLTTTTLAISTDSSLGTWGPKNHNFSVFSLAKYSGSRSYISMWSDHSGSRKMSFCDQSHNKCVLVLLLLKLCSFIVISCFCINLGN